MANNCRLIDTSVVLKHFDGYGFGQECDAEIILDYIAEGAPTVDAVEVVRCKDCKHCKPDENIIGAYGDCDRFERDNDNSIVSADDFCSYGERREGE